ncbi:hypothetical protein ACIBFB_07160 [Nocardiopsis sp. NPDC050513]|uniref:hypothetical protein n=1 Tax=Nocardiopsis sp. NPDC050513 TaxID=3364338 RepID=UPI0037A9D602
MADRDSELRSAADQQWANTLADWDEAKRRVMQVRETARKSVEYSRENRPEHLPTIRLSGDQASDLAVAAAGDFIDTITSRQFDLRYAMGVWGDGVTPAVLHDIVTRDRHEEQTSREKLDKAMGKAMDLARPSWLYKTSQSAAASETVTARAHAAPTGLYAPRPPRTRGTARTTVSAARAAQRRGAQPRRGRAQS